ncbi:hypothetical protein D3C83_177000 [compost metagenome]
MFAVVIDAKDPVWVEADPRAKVEAVTKGEVMVDPRVPTEGVISNASWARYVGGWASVEIARGQMGQRPESLTETG